MILCLPNGQERRRVVEKKREPLAELSGDLSPSSLTALRSCCDAFEAISQSAIALTRPLIFQGRSGIGASDGPILIAESAQPSWFGPRKDVDSFRSHDMTEMLKIEAIYYRTEAGVKAWACADSGLPKHYRQILGQICGPTDIESIRAAIGSGYSDVEIFTWLDELDTLGFIETDRSFGIFDTALTIRMNQWFRDREAA